MKALLTTCLSLILASCAQKDYTCMCSDPLKETEGFLIHDTKHKASEKCENTVNPHNSSKCFIME